MLFSSHRKDLWPRAIHSVANISSQVLDSDMSVQVMVLLGGICLPWVKWMLELQMKEWKMVVYIIRIFYIYQ